MNARAPSRRAIDTAPGGCTSAAEVIECRDVADEDVPRVALEARGDARRGEAAHLVPALIDAAAVVGET